MSSLRSQDSKGQVTGAEVLPPRASHGLTPVRMTPGLQVPLMRDGLWKHAPYACPRISPGEILKPPSILTGRPGVLVCGVVLDRRNVLMAISVLLASYPVCRSLQPPRTH